MKESTYGHNAPVGRLRPYLRVLSMMWVAGWSPLEMAQTFGASVSHLYEFMDTYNEFFPKRDEYGKPAYGMSTEPWHDYYIPKNSGVGNRSGYSTANEGWRDSERQNREEG